MKNSSQKAELLNLFQQWALHFGYISGRIDIKSDDELASFATNDCTLTAHAPLWGTKPGAEKSVPAAVVRKKLSGMLRYVRLERHDMHIAVDGKQLCIFFFLKGKLRYFPLFHAVNVPLAFVLEAVDTPQGLRIKEIHEWPAASPEEALNMMVEKHGWSNTAKFEKHVAFGAAS